MALTPKQLVFIDEYLKDFNATQAAIRAGYSPKTAYNSGWENVRKREVADVLHKRLNEKAMSADEALTRLADIARSNIADFARVDSGASIEQIRDKSHVIKKFKRKVTYDKNENRYEEIELELYDAQAALVDVLKVHGRFKDVHTNLNYDLSKATDEQLQRIAAGDDPAAVLANSNTSAG